MPLRLLRVSVAVVTYPYDDGGGIASGGPGERVAKGGILRWAVYRLPEARRPRYVARPQ